MLMMMAFKPCKQICQLLCGKNLRCLGAQSQLDSKQTAAKILCDLIPPSLLPFLEPALHALSLPLPFFESASRTLFLPSPLLLSLHCTSFADPCRTCMLETSLVDTEKPRGHKVLAFIVKRMDTQASLGF